MICIIQARMSSTRLPGKVCLEVQGIPLLKRVCDRVVKSQYVTKIIVATSKNKEDDAIEAYCKTSHLSCHRGPLEDVAQRFLEIVKENSIYSFVRICADSPLIDPHLIDKAITLFKNNAADVITNTFSRSFPKGQSVEVIKASTFIDNYPQFNDYHKEHLTSYFYEYSNQFSIINFKNDIDFSSINHSIDTFEDLSRIEDIIRRTNNTHCSWIEYVNAEKE